MFDRFFLDNDDIKRIYFERKKNGAVRIYFFYNNYDFLTTGRRSRRNSFTEDSQLTIENFGGSQDHLNMVGRTLERERKYSNSTVNQIIGKCCIYIKTNTINWHNLSNFPFWKKAINIFLLPKK